MAEAEMEVEAPANKRQEDSPPPSESGSQASRRRNSWASHGWWSQAWWSSQGQWGSTASFRAEDFEDPELSQMPELLPELVLGWLLLHRSGLDAKERSVVLAATRNSLALGKVEDALKAQWQDEDLETHDSRQKITKGGASAFMATFGGEDAETWYEEEDEAGDVQETAGHDDQDFD